jgi:hypothetical protein
MKKAPFTRQTKRDHFIGSLKLMNCPSDRFERSRSLCQPYNMVQLIQKAHNYCKLHSNDAEKVKEPERIDLRQRNLMICWFAYHLDAFDRPNAECRERTSEAALEWDLTLDGGDEGGSWSLG